MVSERPDPCGVIQLSAKRLSVKSAKGLESEGACGCRGPTSAFRSVQHIAEQDYGFRGTHENLRTDDSISHQTKVFISLVIVTPFVETAYRENPQRLTGQRFLRRDSSGTDCPSKTFTPDGVRPATVALG